MANNKSSGGLSHEKIETNNFLMIVLILLVLLVGGLVEIIPLFFQKSTTEPVKGLQPYTALQLAGRDIYVREGCYNCHSQMIRPMFAETERYGEYSKPGEFVYDRPFQWGSRRIGPDLAREGGRQNDLWHLQHFWKPTDPSSVMPSYGYLFFEKADYKSIPDRLKAVAYLGAEYPDEVIERGDEVSREQARKIVAEIVKQGGTDRTFFNPNDANDSARVADSERYRLLEDSKVVALIAYMQRLGTDINAPATPATPPSETTAVPDPQPSVKAGGQ